MRNNFLMLWWSAWFLGLLIGIQDFRSTNDDSEPVTLLLLIACAGILGFAEPHRAWRWAIPVGLGLPAVSIAAKALGNHDHFHPDTYGARMLLIPVALFAALIGAYCGALLRGLRRRGFQG